VSLAALDAVTIDAYGTLVELDRPLERLDEALAARGVERTVEDVARAFRTEVAYYSEHKVEGRDEASLTDLRHRCAQVFVEALGAPELDFTDDFVRSLAFVPLPGVPETLARLRAHGLALAVVSNWDVGLHEHLETLGLGSAFAAVVTSAELGVAKPDGGPLRHALERLGVEPARALHVGDDADDERAAAAAGTSFAPAPLAGAIA
jgi:HAD superfamily hydrolase (TIGR01509 family)